MGKGGIKTKTTIMKREIKFRFWLGHTKKMTYEHPLIDMANSNWDFTEDIIPLQFTGLIDKYGKEIYEGDIVRGVGEHKGQSEVFFDTNCYTYQPMSFLNDYNGGNYEIIGSIYENPELLNP